MSAPSCSAACIPAARAVLAFSNPQAISLVVATAQQVTGARRIASAGSSHTPSPPTDPVRHQQRQDHLHARTAEQARAADIRS